MAWPTPMDPHYAGFRPVAWGLLALVAAVLCLAPLLATRRRRTALRWAALGALGLAAFAWSVRIASQERLEDLGLAIVAFDLPTRAAAAAVAEALALPSLAIALLGLSVAAMRRGAWPEAYFALAAGPGLVGAVLVAKTVLPREPPQPLAFLDGPMAFPADGPALGVTLALAAALLARRLAWPTLGRMGIALGVAAALAPLLAGQTHATDALAGAAVGLAWVAACRAALAVWDSWSDQHAAAARATSAAQAPDAGTAIAAARRPHASWPLGLWARIDAALARIVARPTPWLAAGIALGVALRVASYWTTPLAVDAYSYAAMGRSLQTTGTLTMPWGDVDTFHTGAVPSHHYPPLYPALLAGAYALLGFSQETTHIVAIATSLAALAAVWWCTRDLYGRRAALAVTAAVALMPTLVQNTGQGYSENLVLLLFTLTLWAILKSLERPWWIVAAGLFAGLGYLTKSSLGYFFILAGLGGLAWRLHWRGWRVLRDPSYLAAIAIFGTLVASWAARNIRLFGSWETSAHLSAAYAAAARDPVEWLPLLLACIVFYAAFAYLLHLALLPWLPTLARAPRLQSEHDSGLWLALGLPMLLSAAIDACLWLVEREFFLNNVRYVAFVCVPALWLLARHAKPGPATRAALLATAILLVGGSLFFAKPHDAYDQPIADELGARLQPGDTVGFVDRNNHAVYRYYHQLTENGTRDVRVTIACQHHPLCPADAPRAAELDTTWVLAPYESTSELPAHYGRVEPSRAQGDASRPTELTLWRDMRR